MSEIYRLENPNSTLFVREGFIVLSDGLKAISDFMDKHSVGAIYGDWRENGIRVYAEPYRRTRLLKTPVEPPVLCASSFALAQVGGLNPDCGPLQLYELLLRITEFNVACHLPVVVAQGTRQSIPLKEYHEKAIALANQRLQ